MAQGLNSYQETNKLKDFIKNIPDKSNMDDYKEFIFNLVNFNISDDKLEDNEFTKII